MFVQYGFPPQPLLQRTWEGKIFRSEFVDGNTCLEVNEEAFEYFVLREAYFEDMSLVWNFLDLTVYVYTHRLFVRPSAFWY